MKDRVKVLGTEYEIHYKELAGDYTRIYVRERIGC